MKLYKESGCNRPTQFRIQFIKTQVKAYKMQMFTSTLLEAPRVDNNPPVLYLSRTTQSILISFLITLPSWKHHSCLFLLLNLPLLQLHPY